MRKRLALLLLILFFMFLNSISVFSGSESEKYNELQKQISEISQKLTEVQDRAKSLANQISYMNSQIKLASLKITETEAKITEAVEDITRLEEKIGRLEMSLTKVSEVLLSRITATYKSGNITPILILLSSNDFSEALIRAKYLQLVQAHDKKLMFEIQSTKSDFEEEKKLLDEKKKELDNLKKKLEKQKLSLDQQKKDKEYLLEVTKNDEKRYQQLLATARAEQQALAVKLLFKDGKIHVVYTIGNITNKGHVDADSRIGTMGNTGSPGCSTGSHLHFEYITEGKLVDNKLEGVASNSLNILPNKTVKWFDDNKKIVEISVGSGSGLWPMNNPIITQMYGQTPYSSRYTYNFHTGLDMVDLDDYTIKTVRNGTLYNGTLVCNDSSSLINVAIVDHGERVFTTYLHLSSF